MALAEDTFRNLLRNMGLIRQVMDPYFARHGISGPQWGVLRCLLRAEEDGLSGLRLSEIGERMLIRAPSVTGAIDRLERQGLVARVADPKDLRARRVQLTATGRALHARVLAGHSQQIEALMAGLNTEEQATFARLLDQLAGHLSAMAGAGSRDGDRKTVK